MSPTPWWGWLIAFCVVWVSLVVGGVYVYMARKASDMMSKADVGPLTWSPHTELNLGPSRRTPGGRGRF